MNLCKMLRLGIRSVGQTANHEAPRGIKLSLALLGHLSAQKSRPCSFLCSLSAAPARPSNAISNWHPEIGAIPAANQSKRSHVRVRFILAEHLSTLARPRDPFHWLTEGLPVHVAPSRVGRGVFSCRQLAAGELIHWAAPVVAHPKLDCVNKEQFYRVESAANWSSLNSHCHISQILRNFWFWVQWVNEHLLLVEALEASKQFPASDLEFLSMEWYAGIIARCHLNAFKIAISAPLIGQSLLEGAIAAVEGEGDVGTAVYMLPSFYNHDCDPNVDISWPNNDSSAQLIARRDIEPGEELRITYLDASMGRCARQSFLAEAYGFLCDCPRCQEEAPS